MSRVHAAVERNTNSAVVENSERGESVVELDQFKSTLNAYETPLKELRDSL